jgi:hypothetical protein
MTLHGDDHLFVASPKNKTAHSGEWAGSNSINAAETERHSNRTGNSTDTGC